MHFDHFANLVLNHLPIVFQEELAVFGIRLVVPLVKVNVIAPVGESWGFLVRLQQTRHPEFVNERLLMLGCQRLNSVLQPAAISLVVNDKNKAFSCVLLHIVDVFAVLFWKVARQFKFPNLADRVLILDGDHVDKPDWLLGQLIGLKAVAR